MRKLAMGAVALAVIGSAAIWTLPVVSAEQPAVVRTVLMQQDAPGGQSMALVRVEIPVGGREGRHTHSGPLLVYVMSGAISLDYEGKANITYKAGETFYVETGKIHEGINRGNVPAVAIASFVTPKGQPLTTQVQ
jgi:quercetin dioxygenase-like cupin family protein